MNTAKVGVLASLTLDDPESGAVYGVTVHGAQPAERFRGVIDA